MVQVSSVSGKSALVVGMARSGLSAADFLLRWGAKVKVSEKRPQADLVKEIQFLHERGIEYEVGGHVEKSFLNADLIVVSPGVPLKIPEVKRALQSGKEVISEIELASRYLRGKVIGITGSNGKTTTTTLVGEILRKAGFHVQVGGNIGTALTSLVDQSTPESFSVVELSSFQLEASPTFRPDIAVVLNITADHMDRYDSFEDYGRAKLNIFRNQNSSDFAVINFEDDNLRQSTRQIRSTVFWFSNRNKVEPGTYFDGENLIARWGNHQKVIIPKKSIQLRGLHNVENIAAATTAGLLANAPPQKIAEAIAQFKGVEHRLEWVAEIRGVRFYNDSKATNTDATVKALEAFDAGIILILGGRDKEGDFRVLRPMIESRVKRVILLGEASKKIKSQLSGTVAMDQATNLKNATELAFEQAVPGDTVLLAPACASFDMFENYEHRGRVFKGVVNRLKALRDASSH